MVRDGQTQAPGPSGPWVTPMDLTYHASVPLLGDDGQVLGPALLVDLDGGAEFTEAAVRAAGASDRILIGVCRHSWPGPALQPLTTALDVTIVPPGPAQPPAELVTAADPAAAAIALRSAAGAGPQAATVLAGLLRWTTLLPVPAALDAESLAYSTLLGGPEFARWLVRRGPRPLPPPGAEPVLIRREGSGLHITLNRPERHNAYGRGVRDGLVTALQVADSDAGIDRIVLDGAGPSFCAGGDLDEFGTAPDLVTAHLVRTRAGAGRLMHRLAARLEVHLHGSCIGAGAELPAFAGRVTVHPDARLRLPEVAMGLIPGAGGTVSIPRRIGRWRTLYLALSGATLDADTAVSWGLADRIDVG